MNARQRRMRLPDYLAHMLEAAQLAQKHVGAVSKDEFLANSMMQQAVLMTSCSRTLSNQYLRVVRCLAGIARRWGCVVGASCR